MEKDGKRDIYDSIALTAAVQGVRLHDGTIYVVEACCAGGSGVRPRSWGQASRLGVRRYAWRDVLPQASVSELARRSPPLEAATRLGVVGPPFLEAASWIGRFGRKSFRR